MTTSKAPIRFAFDYISSNAYLAWKVLPALAAKYGHALEPVPVLFAGLLNAHGQMGPAEVPVKSYWMWKNNLRKAKLLGVPLIAPAFHPFNPLLSLRVSSLDMSEDERRRAVDALFDAVWAEHIHVSDADAVARVLDGARLPGKEMVERAAEDDVKQRLRRQTDDAIALGVFGVPTMLVATELFWGYDDLPYLQRYLAGTDPLDPSVVPTERPRASATRRRRP
jgi:2-hydroxychromene-2-carboxylate isomerase